MERARGAEQVRIPYRASKEVLLRTQILTLARFSIGIFTLYLGKCRNIIVIISKAVSLQESLDISSRATEALRPYSQFLVHTNPMS